ncbi:hypothetical protein M405DRAFT_798718 [Rhizopogon salebrosus TDB-379]|nr:hypothetical protein M405DRAFT_798718 [Rhizopogon salebrosus TDB-379]
MSQVSDWITDARRHILPPIHQAAQGPTTSAPYPSQKEQTIRNGIKRRLSVMAELATERELKAAKRQRDETSFPQESEEAIRKEPLKLSPTRSLLNV